MRLTSCCNVSRRRKWNSVRRKPLKERESLFSSSKILESEGLIQEQTFGSDLKVNGVEGAVTLEIIEIV